MTEDEFAKFLEWLHPDRDRAAEEYEKIRRRLIKIFICRGCTIPEDLADDTINRVVRKIQEIGDNYVGDRLPFFIAVAKNVYREYLRRNPPPQTLPVPESSAWADEVFDCLDDCMEHLTQRSKYVVVNYYQGEKREKIDHRKRLAEELGIPLNALRIKACRIRAKLETCVIDCLKLKTPA